jgi:hypothetical protein
MINRDSQLLILLYTQPYSHLGCSVRTKTPYICWSHSSGCIYENTYKISAQHDRLEIQILVLRAMSVYSIITCIRKVPRNTCILTKFLNQALVNWMRSHQRFIDTRSFLLQGRNYSIIMNSVIDFARQLQPVYLG